jgi:hypothetical protein
MILFRPLLAFATHIHVLNLTESYVNSLLEPFKAAQLPCSLEISRLSNYESLSTCSTPQELIEKLLTTTESTVTVFLPSDCSVSLQIQTPYQHSQQTFSWFSPFTLTTSSPTAPDGVISFDALCDAEGSIMSAVYESLAFAVQQILGSSWQKLDSCEFETKGKRIRVELQKESGKLAVLDGSEEIECVNTSLEQVLRSI